MHMVEIPARSRPGHAAQALALTWAVAATAVQAAPPAASPATPPSAPVVAFLLKDGQGQLPWASVAVERGGQPAAEASDLRACDVLRWVPGHGSSVRVASVRGGRTWVLDASQPRLTLPCETSPRPWSERMGQLWETVAGGPREAHVQSATSRGLDDPGATPLHSTPFLAARSLLLAGHRPVYVAWQGGQPPYAVTLRGPDGRLLASSAGLTLPQWQSPRLKLLPGRHQLAVTDARGDTLRMDALEVVPVSQRPPMPPGLAQLPPLEQRWLEAYVLEGWPGGEWGLEALQVLAPWRQRDAAARAWLSEAVAP